MEVDATLGSSHGLWKWMGESAVHKLIVYLAVIATVSLFVQVIATILIGRL